MGSKSSNRLTEQQTQQLIELVRQRPFLYDSSHPDAATIANAWQTISEKMKLKGKGYCLKDKWKNLRDHYIKKRREQNDRSGAKRKLTWRYYGMLTFLNAHRPIGETSGADSTVAEIKEEAEENGGQLDSSVHDSETPSSLDCHVTHVWSEEDTLSQQCQWEHIPAPQSRPEPRSKPKRKSSAVESLDSKTKQLIRETKQDGEEVTVMSKMGANELFFQSCAMRTNKFSAELQAFVHMQVSKILFQAETSPSSCKMENLPNY